MTSYEVPGPLLRSITVQLPSNAITVYGLFFTCVLPDNGVSNNLRSLVFQHQVAVRSENDELKDLEGFHGKGTLEVIDAQYEITGERLNIDPSESL